MAKGASYKKVRFSDDCNITGKTTPENTSEVERCEANTANYASGYSRGYSKLGPGVTKVKRSKVIIWYVKKKGAAFASAVGNQLINGSTHLGAAYIYANTLNYGRQNSRDK